MSDPAAGAGDATGAVTVPMIRALVAEAAQREDRPGVVALAAAPHWAGPDRVDAGEVTARVRPCVSALAVREALRERDPREWLVVLTDRSPDDLGGLLHRFTWHRIRRPDLWRMVEGRFQARVLDQRLVQDGREVAEALLAAEPPDGWPPAPGGALARDTAYELLVQRAAGLQPDRLDPLGLLEWTLDPAGLAGFHALAPAVRTVLAGWLGERTGSAGAGTVAALQAGLGAEAVPLALAAGVLYDPGDERPAILEARGAWRSRHGLRLSADEARAWADVATSLIAGVPAAAADVLARRAQAVLAELGAADLAERSDVLPAGLRRRLRDLGAAVARAADAAGAGAVGPDRVDDVEQAFRALQTHRLAAHEQRSRDVAHMAARLVRWLTAPDPPAPTLAAAVARQVGDDGWVDRARADVWDGEDDPDLHAPYRALCAAVAARRAGHDEQFARLLAADGTTPGAAGLRAVEDVLRDTVVPIARAAPTLLLVLDGMSTAVASELADGLADDRWVELLPGGEDRRPGVLAVLPSVTEASRASLLTGTPAVGGQDAERRGYAELTAALGLRAALFHKRDLEASGGGATLAAPVRQAIQDLATNLVTVVLNTIDDALDRSDPGRIAWTVEAVTHLRPLLRQARDVGRVVVLVSDHGHVVERGEGVYRPAATGAPGPARWRTEPPPAGDGEVAVAGRRVLLGGGRVVLPWAEGIHYVPKKAGYHGGAAPAECVIPLTVHTVSHPPTGWQAAPPQQPAWWLGSTPAAAPGPAAAPPARHADGLASFDRGRLRSAAPPTPSLFEATPSAGLRSPAAGTAAVGTAAAGAAAARTAAAGAPADDLAARLVASRTYTVQRERAARVRLPDPQVAALLRALVRAGGRLPEAAAAAAVGVPLARWRGTLAVVQRLLNVEGYEVVGYDPDGVTVRLDEALLREQFDLGDRR